MASTFRTQPATKEKSPPAKSFRKSAPIPQESFKQDLELQSSKKRKRSRQAELDDEVLELKGMSIEATSGRRRTKRFSYLADSDDETGDLDGDTKAKKAKFKQNINTFDTRTSSSADGETRNLDFKAVTKYEANGDIDYFTLKDLQKCEELWERIGIVKSNWESKAGEDWCWEFIKPGYSPKFPHCVTTKLAKGRTKWVPGCEAKYACKDCVNHGRPCFAFTPKTDLTADGWRYSEMRLLPLHNRDRIKPVVVGKTEIRHWLNDDIEITNRDDASSEDEYID